MKRSSAMLRLCAFTALSVLTVLANQAWASTWGDDFEDGVIDPLLWEWGGRNDLSPPYLGWNFSHEEIIDTNGYLKIRVWGDSTGDTSGAEAWVQAEYDYNNGLSHIVNFAWATGVSAWHVDMYAIQITDGSIPEGSDIFWFGNAQGSIDGPTWKNLYFQYEQPNMSLVPWSIHIDAATQTATLFDGPNLTGEIIGQKTLPAEQAWRVRFIQQDGTSSGFPGGDNLLNLYDFCSGFTLVDCNSNGILDEHDIAGGTSEDCNTNGVPDECDIAVGTSDDCQPNGIPDECELGCGEVGIMGAALPSARTNLSCTEDPCTGKIYCFGGALDASVLTDQIVEYDPETDTLTEMGAVLPSARFLLACAADPVTCKIYCFGGWDWDAGFLSQIIEYDPGTDTLTNMGAVLPSPRRNMGCAASPAAGSWKIYCFGGWGGSGLPSDQILEYDPGTDTCVTKSATLPTGRDFVPSVAHPVTGKIYCFGGSVGPSQVTDQILEFDPTTADVPGPIPIMDAVLPSARFALDNCAANAGTGKIYCFGGRDYTTFLDQIVEFDPTMADVPGPIPIMDAVLPSARSGGACAAGSSTGKIYCFGGYDGSYLDEIVEYDPVCGEDCNSNSIPDECDIAHDCCGTGHGAGCSYPRIEDCVCEADRYCCLVEWDEICVAMVTGGECGPCDIDCNSNAVPDECDIAHGTSQDCQPDAIPDECQLGDVDTNGLPDNDCNTNSVPDDCEPDFDGDGTIDECDPDIDDDGVPNEPDVCDFTPLGSSPVMDPDSCLYGTLRGDYDDDCDVDLVDYARFQAESTGPNP